MDCSKIKSYFAETMSKAKLKKHMLSMTKEQVVDVMLELYLSLIHI